jgi:hypothetical protein
MPLTTDVELTDKKWKGQCTEPGQTEYAHCPNMRCSYAGMDGERYRCAVCGESYFLDYEEMK